MWVSLQKVVLCLIPLPGWSDNNEYVASHNPLAKIPCLAADNVPGGIYDSRVICEYLENLGVVNRKKDSQYWQFAPCMLRLTA
jgi:glutathione S-transferase